MGKNIVNDILLDGEFEMNSMTNELWKWLGLHDPKPTPYMHGMVDQTITKPVLFIKDFKTQIHGISYTVTFIVMNNVLDSTYSMLLGWPWLHNARTTHD